MESDLIKNYIKELGIKEYGFKKLSVLDESVHYFRNREGRETSFEEKEISKRTDFSYIMREGKGIISIAFPYYYRDESSKYSFSLYTRGKDYHRVVMDYLNKICDFIIQGGGKAIPFVDNNSLPERYLAQISNVGFIGKNSMVINKRYGSYIFLGEIITDIDLIEEYKEVGFCGECKRCLEACPTKSLKLNNFNFCLSNLTQIKELEDSDFDKFRGSLFGCDICQKVCPYNEGAEISNILDFLPLSFMENFDIRDIIYMDKDSFNKYKETSCSWRGKNPIIRNAIINIIREKEGYLLSKEFKSPYIKEYYNRLLKHFKL